ncbi:CitMHS family transporter [Dietzia maris]|uniref:CitMHS family transporter n=1 Tax=Dietzia maris TaxID=37915 RepID=UPI0015FA0FC1|nr:citrate:proton symporter [Dietzia sp. DQ11-71]MBB1018600.1 citrate transporter [Dietzia sp. DQ11-71]
MAAIVGFAMLALVIGLLLGRKLSPLVAFTVIPVIAGLVLGYGLTDLGSFIAAGVETVAPMVALFIFAILYFGLMRDRGLFEPVVQLAIRVAGGKPIRLTVVTVLLATVAHLDGAGATTFLLTIPTLLPIYDRLRVRRVVLLMLVGVSAGIMNLVPWGGTTVRAAAALGIDADEIWRPLFPVQIFGLAVALGFAVLIGMVETRRLARGAALVGQQGSTDWSGPGRPPSESEAPQNYEDKSGHLSVSDWRYWVNIALTLALLTVLFMDLVPLHICFMVAFGIALAVNYKTPVDQDASLKRNASEALYMGAVLLAVGVFLGVLNGTAMMEGITDTITGILPEGTAGWAHIVIGIFAVPLDLILGADPYAFGLMPVVDQVAASGGVDSYSVARSMLIGQNAGFVISPLTPSVYLAIGLAQVPLGRHIRFTLPWVWASGLLMLAFAVLIGAVAI